MKTSMMGALLAAAGLMVAGCQEPTGVVPVYPPGMEPSRMPNIPAGEGAQALGEQGVAATNQNKVASGGEATSPPTPIGQPRTTPSGLVYETLKEGDGPQAQTGQRVQMHYTGTLEDGTKFDSSRDRGTPFEVRIGNGEVIKGWDEGVPGMKVGEQRKLTIPGNLGYGPAGSPPKIPGNATLIFDVELMRILD
ncbi:FKBP-type peptidyl-prolyl cis-trans isomerase [Tundrisphaera sp. TA3]|uniref:FKBP-type peptidyl-prolyl cis-trans isomerase n=1 Tax=Tundrisphaera sp. TA3 TaxID=3435775 RepID=UPI003EBAE442